MHSSFISFADVSLASAKNPLTITAKAMQVFEGPVLQAYDIGCSFGTVIKHSSLGPDFERRGSHSCVNAFHGYTHNFACQTQHHPNVMEGIGLEDLETLERIFSASNNLANITRYATPYCRRAFIAEYFYHWDNKKYANLSQYIYNNLVQAADIIDSELIPLADEMDHERVSLDNLERWKDKERAYFATLGKEKPWNIHAMSYVEALQDLQAARQSAETTFAQFLGAVPDGWAFAPIATGPVNYGADTACTHSLKWARELAHDCLRAVELEVLALEVKLGITRRWEPTDEPYIETVKYIRERKYQHALNELQCLVVQWLFELHKLNLSHTGIVLAAVSHFQFAEYLGM